ncbi:hypothetical protein DTO013E5_9950 [Penicillium roqueforti]|nr:uncharacterized protein LCP9604111_2562 [Penicillium roqueforti]KAF9251161.1 hypothetical protein LCP9604111_2562 [Penicillium roqueforti]KAI1837981.1 hypothetical protein CBS147337_1204 [Penicillium roqueforti]KAI2678671.1 hypothetical protein CBS147355_4556 [Penicillium roqueforti]KAI2692757.1 hypothetical protein LCP963914a_851 [Penicillium roqueforti]KAI2701930.1 hypothetical protein CBS147332_7706 [Penicillium roqueforti]
MHLSTISVLLSVALAQASSFITPNRHATNKEPDYPKRCYPDPCKGVTHVNSTAVCGDPRLGPKVLPRYFPLSNELKTYARFGELCPIEFLEKWTVNASDPTAYWIYPDSDGFAQTSTNASILGNFTLRVGQKLDRFGSEFGKFLAPLGAPYIERSLPPSNLFAPTNSSFPYNYHVYQVTKEFDVLLGPISPWFEQPGFGSQLLALTSVADLLEEGALKRLDLQDYDEAEEYSAGYLPAPNKTST